MPVTRPATCLIACQWWRPATALVGTDREIIDFGGVVSAIRHGSTEPSSGPGVRDCRRRSHGVGLVARRNVPCYVTAESLRQKVIPGSDTLRRMTAAMFFISSESLRAERRRSHDPLAGR
jgi:hypothetical protein